ncbi:hypothetical protein JYU29_02020 [Tianweitania sp. BSSL-BM11]|uniref:Oligosaccharide repeat unit polymerase n=1 Tax=Tianweitania aestuarii TaxID=2814886 RepID=A0ABS5RQY7_9HYPH|nr:hypothetical protein [Tianweitania aestuarii]MBS9719458.1 hypothetical protein [Tianweitania aestuarii]
MTFRWTQMTAASASPLRIAASEVQPWELWALAGLLGFALFVGLLDDTGAAFHATIIVPLGLASVLSAGAIHAVQREPLALWTGLFWMRLSTAVYFGIGSLAHRFMNEIMLTMLRDFFAASDAEIARFNLLATMCSLVILGTVAFASQLWPQRSCEPQKGDDRLMLAAAFLFGLPGFATKYLVIFPNAMGAFGENAVLPGVLTQLVWLAPVSIFLLVSWTLRHRPGWIIPLAGLVLLDAFFGFLRFSKGEALLPILMLVLAVLQHRFTFKRAALAVVLLAALFPVLQSVTAAGRAELIARYGTIRSASFGERLAILSGVLADPRDDDQAEFQGALVRIAYVHAAAPAMAMYDAGQPGNSLSYVPLVFIPRLLWPDKPLFDMGQSYTELLTGSDTSSTWMGYFAEAYWNLGWLGVPVVMIPLGLIFFATGRYTLWTLRNGEWLHFPAVFLGLYMGARMDGLIAGDVVASTLTILLVYAVARIATPLVCDLVGSSPAPLSRAIQ